MTRTRAETLATNASGLTLARWIHAAAFAQGHGLGPGDFREARRDWEADVDPAEWGHPRRPSKRHHATKKSPAQLQREIDETLAAGDKCQCAANYTVGVDRCALCGKRKGVASPRTGRNRA